MNRESFEQAKVEVHDGIGPCTKALNDYYIKSRGAPFFDYVFFHADLFYMKYTHRVWSDQLWHEVDSPIVREFKDEDMELANLCLYRFQTLCDQKHLSTRNPISFFEALDSYWKNTPRNFNIVASLFLWATTDRGFLFDSAIQGSVLSTFVTRAFLDQVGRSDNKVDNIAYSPILTSTKLSPPLITRKAHMQEQVRYFHLMLPNRIIYSDRWTDFTIPLVKEMQHRNKCYCEDLDPNFCVDDTIQRKLVDAALDCFIWYVSSRKHLDLTNQNDPEKVAHSLQSINDFRDNTIGDIVKAIVEDIQRIAVFPFLLYRVFTKSYSTIESANVPDVKRILSNIQLSPIQLFPNMKIGSDNRAAAQWKRMNLLLFKQICRRTGPFLPKGTVERSLYLLEFSEEITMECYIDDELLNLEVTDNAIREYIREGEHTGTAVLPELKELVDYVEKNLEISPFDVLNYRAWNETPQTLRDFMDSSRGGKGSGRGRKPTKRKMLSGLLPKLDDYHELEKTYYQLVFKDKSGYGSGLPTYEWAFRLSEIIDRIIGKPDVQSALQEELASYPELVELSVHQFFLSKFKQEAIEIVAALGKRILYGNDVQNLMIEELEAYES